MGTSQSVHSLDGCDNFDTRQLLGQEYDDFKAKLKKREPVCYDEFCEIFLKRQTLSEEVKKKIFEACCLENKNYVDPDVFLRTLAYVRFGNVTALRRIFGDIIPSDFRFDSGYWLDCEDSFPDELDMLLLITNLDGSDLHRVISFFEANCRNGFAEKSHFEKVMFPTCSSSIIQGWFNMADLLGCGKVSLIEYVLAVSSISQGPLEECFKNMARIWDQGNKGFLDVTDIMVLYNDLNITTNYRNLHTLNANGEVSFVDFVMWMTAHQSLKSIVLKKLILICNICLGVPLTTAQKNQGQAFDKMLEILEESTLDDFKNWTLVPVGWPERAITAIGLGNFLPPIFLRNVICGNDPQGEYDRVYYLKPQLKLGETCIAVPTAWIFALYTANRQDIPRMLQRKTVKFSDLRPDFKWPESWHDFTPGARIFLDLYPIVAIFFIQLDKKKPEYFKLVQVDRTEPIMLMVSNWVEYETRLYGYPFQIYLRASDDIEDDMEISGTMSVADLDCQEKAVFHIVIETHAKDETPEENVNLKHMATTPAGSNLPNYGTGISNRARECYINSVLQCLSNIKSFKQIALESYLRSVERHRPHPFAEALRAVMMDLWAVDKECINADYLKRLFRERHSHMDDDQDQDAHEALEFILEMVHEELKTVDESLLSNNNVDNSETIVSQGLAAWHRHVAKNVSFITHSFDGLTGSEIQCRGCNYISPSFETFRSFNVTLHRENNLCVRYYYANATQTKFLERNVVIPQTFTTTDFKHKIAKEQGVAVNKLHMYLPNMGDEAAVDNSEYLMVKVAPLSRVEPFVVYELPCKSDPKLTYHLCLQRVIRMHPAFIAPRIDGYTVDVLGPPLLFEVPEKITGKEFYKMVDNYIQKIKALYPIKPGHQMNRAIADIKKTKDLPFFLVYTDKDGIWCSHCYWLNYCRGCLVPNDDTPVDLMSHITIQWKPTHYILHMRHLFTLLHSVGIKDTRPKLLNNQITSLEDALSETIQSEILDTPLTCEGCKKKCFFQKSLYFVITPPTLVINLQRFALSEQGWVKDKRHVTYPLVNFDMAPYFGPGFMPDSLYECTGFIVHIGELHTGHYISYYKKNDAWYVCNDEKVISVPLSQTEFHNASVIFYEQQNPLPQPVLIPELQEESLIPVEQDNDTASKELKDENATFEKCKIKVDDADNSMNSSTDFDSLENQTTDDSMDEGVEVN